MTGSGSSHLFPLFAVIQLNISATISRHSMDIGGNMVGGSNFCTHGQISGIGRSQAAFAGWTGGKGVFLEGWGIVVLCLFSFVK